MCVYVCACVCGYICVYMYICVYVCVCVYVFVCVCDINMKVLMTIIKYIVLDTIPSIPTK